MNPVLRTSLVVVGLVAAVVLVSVFFGYSVKPDPVSVPAAPSTAGTGAPAAADLHPSLVSGLEALRQNRPAEARAAFESVPPGDPSYPTALRELTRVLAVEGDLESALRTALRGVSLTPDDAGLWVQAAWLYYRNDRYEEAELAGLRALEIDSGNAEIRYAIGLFRIAQNHLVEAIPTYRRAMELNGSEPVVMRAVENLAQLGTRHPEMASVHYGLAFFANSLGRTELEIQELEAFLSGDPRGPAADVARTRLDEARGGSR